VEVTARGRASTTPSLRCRDLESPEECPSATIIDSKGVKNGLDAREAVGFDAGKRIKAASAICCVTRSA
jgi:hypothetical protein